MGQEVNETFIFLFENERTAYIFLFQHVCSDPGQMEEERVKKVISHFLPGGVAQGGCHVIVSPIAHRQRVIKISITKNTRSVRVR